MSTREQDNEINQMRMKLLTVYPRGYIRGQRIIDMPGNQIYAIYKRHLQRKINMSKPRMARNKQVPGQMNMLSEM